MRPRGKARNSFKKLSKKLEFPDYENRSTVIEQVLELVDFLHKSRPSRTLEIGLGVGVNACGILMCTGARHVAMDPYQKSLYKNVGLENLAGNGFGRAIEFYEGQSLYVLPYLWRSKRKFDFILINGDRKFDYVLMDFFLSDKILDVGGHVLLNCSWMPSIKRVESTIISDKKNEYSLQKKIHAHSTLFKKIKDFQ